jgi:hypothetical protein
MQWTLQKNKTTFMQRDMTAPRYLRRGLPLRKVEANARQTMRQVAEALWRLLAPARQDDGRGWSTRH